MGLGKTSCTKSHTSDNKAQVPSIWAKQLKMALAKPAKGCKLDEFVCVICLT